MRILVTGAAGFIGYHLSRRFLEDGLEVMGLDNLNDYYDVRLKEARLELLRSFERFSFHRVDLADLENLKQVFSKLPSHVVNLAAQAGVRWSLDHPLAYSHSNLDGFLHVLECCRHARVEHLVYASSSSVYGGNQKLPFAVGDNVDHPLSLYAATKKANELMAHSYSALYGLPVTGLRFFTVYGPWGRPDMAMFLFAKAIQENQPIQVFNHGHMRRDFTYVDDIVEAVARLTFHPAQPDESWNGREPRAGTSWAPYRLHNIGNSTPVEVLHVIEIMEQLMGRKVEKMLLPIQPGDVPATWADVDSLVQEIDFCPKTSIETGIRKFIEWYLDYSQGSEVHEQRHKVSL